MATQRVGFLPSKRETWIKSLAQPQLLGRLESEPGDGSSPVSNDNDHHHNNKATKSFKFPG